MILIRLILFAVVILLFVSCREGLPVYEDLSKENFTLVDQNGKTFSFPSDLQGSAFVIGYIFTNCPDICPLTTNNMRIIQESLQKQELEDVHFVSISFDTDTDTPEILRNVVKEVMGDYDES